MEFAISAHMQIRATMITFVAEANALPRFQFDEFAT